VVVGDDVQGIEEERAQVVDAGADGARPQPRSKPPPHIGILSSADRRRVLESYGPATALETAIRRASGKASHLSPRPPATTWDTAKDSRGSASLQQHWHTAFLTSLRRRANSMSGRSKARSASDERAAQSGCRPRTFTRRAGSLRSTRPAWPGLF
jgi:hypothetical protein